MPVLEIIKLLTISVGLPYFLLASNGPLVQVWFHRLFPTQTAYRLYAVSNVGSLLGLISYPLLVEPLFTLPVQGWNVVNRVSLLCWICYLGSNSSLATSVINNCPPGNRCIWFIGNYPVA